MRKNTFSKIRNYYILKFKIDLFLFNRCKTICRLKEKRAIISGTAIVDCFKFFPGICIQYFDDGPPILVVFFKQLVFNNLC